MNKVLLVLVLSLFLSGILYAEDPVHFIDQNLKTAVESELWVSDPTPTDMLGLTSLRAGSLGITTISGLEYAKNLRTLWLRLNYITDISPLSGLTQLEDLVLHKNYISDLSPLSGLTELSQLNLNDTHISDISALSGLTNLRELILFYNEIHDISPLVGLTALTRLDLRENPLNEDAYTIHIPQIIANNPGVRMQHDRGPFLLQLSSTIGGAVIYPGEGEYIIDDGKPVFLEAKADPCFVFVGFTGSYSTTANPLSLHVGQNHQICAYFQSVLDVLCVDDDSPSDPGPCDTRISDPGENGKPEHPFDRIQEAIDGAADGATIFVHAGTYRENIDLLGKRIVLTGFDPENPGAAAWPVIDGGGASPVVSLSSGRDPNGVLTGLVITGGNSQSVGAIRCTGSSLTMVNCLIVGNHATDWDATVIRCTNSNAAFINCTIADNRAGQFGASLFLVNSRVMVANSILWGNTPREIQADEDSSSSVRYSVVAGGWPGPGNLTTDPLFVSGGRWVDRDHPDTVVGPKSPNAVWAVGDYHLQSQAGRWEPQAAQWVQDRTTSPCIDAGDPSTPVGQEPSANGGIIDLGAYGGTVEASRSFSVGPSP